MAGLPADLRNLSKPAGEKNARNLVRVLRALGLLDRLDAIVPEPVLSPLKQFEAADRQRKRAVSKSKPKPGDTPAGWSWGDDDAGDDDAGDAS